MSTIDYLKLQAKNLMRDWETHQENDEGLYVYTPRFFDIDGLLLAFDEDETKFCLQRAQHLIAQLVGFNKWNDLIKASDEELRLAKIVFDGCKASDDMVTASSEWKMYCFSNNIDGIDVKSRIYLAQKFFSLPLDEEFKTNPIQDQLDNWYKNFRPFIEQASLISEFLLRVCNRIEVLAESSTLISSKLQSSILVNLIYVKKQIRDMDEIIQLYQSNIDRITDEKQNGFDWVPDAIEDFKKKCIAVFSAFIIELTPEIVSRFGNLKQQLAPDSEIVSLLHKNMDELIEMEAENAEKIRVILGRNKEQ
jgi:hypothetical protein